MISRKFLFSLLSISVIILFSIPFCFGGEVVLTGVIIPRGFDCEKLQAMENNTLINYSLSNDVDCSMTNPTSINFDASGPWADGKGFRPIGDDRTGHNFEGTFDGNGYKITNLYINRPDEDRVGLFGYVCGGTIKNVGLENVDITGSVDTIGGNFVGGLVGQAASATVENCYVTGSIKNNNNAYCHTGGLVGWLCGTEVVNSHFSGSVDGGGFVGGLVGYLAYMGEIVNSYATGSVNANGNVGGLTGGSLVSTGFEITNCYATNSVNSAYGGAGGGGLVGYASDNTFITNSYWDISRSGLDRCCAIVDGTCTIECTGKNAGGSEPNYWYYSTNPPLNEWDFTTIWKEETDDYPSLRKP